MAKTRAIRFSERDEALIAKFLEENEIFDFSTLARIAILNFIANPSVSFRPVKNLGQTKKAKRATSERLS